MNKVLILTNKDDVTVDFVINRLNNKKSDYFRFNTEEIGFELSVKILPLKNEFIIIDNCNGKEYYLSDYD